MNKIWLGWLLFASWVLCTSWLLYQSGNQHYGEFDPQRQLQLQQQQLPALNRLAAKASSNTASSAVLLHVLDPDCPCSNKAKEHIKQLQAELQDKKLQQIVISVHELEQSGISVPATPLVIYLENQQLVYSGPYASGPACSTENSMLTAVLQQQNRLQGSWFNSETWSCRCLNDTTTI